MVLSLEGLPMSIRNVHLFVFDSMSDWQASFAIAGINNPRLQTGHGRYRVVTVGSTTKPIATMGGLRVLPDVSLAEIHPHRSAMLILPGGDSWESTGHTDAVELARAFFVEAVPIAAICSATLALACSGLLDDFHHTSNSRAYLSRTGYRGSNFYLEAPAVTDESLITASGTAPVQFAREIFRTLGLNGREGLDASPARYKFGHAPHSFEPSNCLAR
jgi:putative intracellular protease/amidase